MKDIEKRFSGKGIEMPHHDFCDKCTDLCFECDVLSRTQHHFFGNRAVESSFWCAEDYILP